MSFKKQAVMSLKKWTVTSLQKKWAVVNFWRKLSSRNHQLEYQYRPSSHHTTSLRIPKPRLPVPGPPLRPRVTEPLAPFTHTGTSRRLRCSRRRKRMPQGRCPPVPRVNKACGTFGVSRYAAREWFCGVVFFLHTSTVVACASFSQLLLLSSPKVWRNIP